MKINRIVRTAVALCMSVFGLMALATLPTSALSGTYYKWTGASSNTAGLNGCTIDCWSIANNWDISSDGGVTYNPATQAPSSSDNGGAGDNLVFNYPTLTANTTVTNDLSNLNVDSITFTGTSSSSYDYTLAGNAINLAAGIDDSVTTYPTINLNMNLTADQTFTANSGQLYTGTGETVALGSNSLTIGGNAASYIGVVLNSITGSGALNVTGYGQILSQTNSSYSGAINIASGAELGIAQGPALGSGNVTIGSGGALDDGFNSFEDQAIGTPTTTDTISNNITLAGTGPANVYGAIIAQSSAGSVVLTLSGTITLSGDAQVVNGDYTSQESSLPTSTATFDLTGSYTPNSYALTALANSSTILNLPTSSSSSATASGTSVGTPDTGFGLTTAQPLVVLGVSLTAAACLVVTAHRLKASRH